MRKVLARTPYKTARISIMRFASGQAINRGFHWASEAREGIKMQHRDKLYGMEIKGPPTPVMFIGV